MALSSAGVVRAFDLRANVRALFQPPPSNIPELDAFRALGILLTLAIHTTLGIMVFQGRAAFGATMKNCHGILFTYLAAGDFGVVVFFTLSGFLIASVLLRERDRTQTIDLKYFYLSRALRLLPPYYLALGLQYYFADPISSAPRDTAHVWTYFVYINNYYPRINETQVMPHAWSLAVEEQFYLLLPISLLLIYRFVPSARRFAVLVGVTALSVVVRAVVFYQHRSLWLDASLWMSGFGERMRLLYFPSHARFGELLSGVLICYAIRERRLYERLRERVVWANLGAGVACAVALATPYIWTIAKFRQPSNAIGHAILVIVGPIAFTTAIAYLMAFATSRTRGSGLMSRLMSARLWYPIAQLSYSAYLLHMLAIGYVFKHVFLSPPSSVIALLGMFSVNLALNLLIAVPVHLFVERPFMSLRRMVL